MKITTSTSMTSTNGATLISVIGRPRNRRRRRMLSEESAMAYFTSSSWRDRIAPNSAAKPSSRCE